GLYQLGHLACALVRTESGHNRPAIGFRLVLTHLPLAFEHGNLNLDSDNGSLLRFNVVTRRIGDRPWLRAWLRAQLSGRLVEGSASRFGPATWLCPEPVPSRSSKWAPPCRSLFWLRTRMGRHKRQDLETQRALPDHRALATAD